MAEWNTHFTVDTLVDIQRVLNIQLFNVEPSESLPTLYVNFTVSAEPASLNEDIYEPLQRVIDEAGGLQATTLTVGY